MAKYYVRCGQVRRVVQRDSRERAALDVVVEEVYSGDGCARALSGLTHMGLVTSVSEHGFFSRKASFYPTHMILCRQGPFEGPGESDAAPCRD